MGGSLENRRRLSGRIIQAVREQCGKDFIVGLSVSYTESTHFAMDMQELLDIVAHYDESGQIDYISCGRGNYIEYDSVMPTFVQGESLTVSFSGKVKNLVKNAAVITESHVRTPANADYAVSSGACDLVSIVRGQIADPHLANKALDGNPEDIRGCVSCNQMCWGRRSRDYWISCLVNPSAGREFELGGDRFLKTDKSKSVLVVGGGPAGLECARVAAERGHKVTLCEASSELGGQYRFAGMAPRRGQILELLQWYEIQLRKLGVTVEYHTPIDDSDIDNYLPEVLVIATGSMPTGTGVQHWKPEFDALPGVENGHVYACEDVFTNQAQLGSKVIVVDEGGNWRGLGTTWHLASIGHEVTLVTPDAFVGKELARTTADFPIRKQLAQLGTTFTVESVVDHWDGKQAKVRSLLSGKVQSVDASAIVFATTNAASNELELSLNKQHTVYAVHTIGDCVAPRQAPYAFYEGRKLGLVL